MPNLDYDPQNPTDLLGQPIGEGDYVAWGTTYGRSAALCVSRIERIRFVDRGRNEYGTRKDVPRAEAKGYTLHLVPIKGTNGFTETTTDYDDVAEKYILRPIIPKANTVQLVQNIVKLTGPALAEAQRLEADREERVRLDRQERGA